VRAITLFSSNSDDNDGESDGKHKYHKRHHTRKKVKGRERDKGREWRHSPHPQPPCCAGGSNQLKPGPQSPLEARSSERQEAMQCLCFNLEPSWAPRCSHRKCMRKKGAQALVNQGAPQGTTAPHLTLYFPFIGSSLIPAVQNEAVLNCKPCKHS
jgi:hypothetical protein